MTDKPESNPRLAPDQPELGPKIDRKNSILKPVPDGYFQARSIAVFPWIILKMEWDHAFPDEKASPVESSEVARDSTQPDLKGSFYIAVKLRSTPSAEEIKHLPEEIRGVKIVYTPPFERK